ncbi:MAG: ABC transporter permease [Micrococcales bacterium]|nr:ABC transporter permease [Micrococcales bacterium]
MSTTTRPETQPTQTPRASGRREAAWPVVATREIVVKMTDKSFIIGTLVSLALIIGMLGVQVWLGQREDTVKVAVTTSQAETFAKEIGTSAQAADKTRRLAVQRVADTAAAEQLLRDEKADVYLSQGDKGWQLTYLKEDNSTLQQTAQQVALGSTLQQTAAKAGLSQGDLAKATTVQSKVLEGSTDKMNLAKAVSFIFAILFFMSALGFGMQIAQSVVEEKQSRIVEILATAIPVRQLLAGKVIGNTVMALGQMVLYTAAGLVGLAFTDYKRFLPAVSGAAGWYLGFFLAGFLALACIWAVAGALSSRQEDLQATTMPLTMGLSIVYILGFMATGAVREIVSFVPIASSVVMPGRLVAGDASWWEAAIALALNLVFAAVTIIIGERLYRRALLQTGGRLSLKQAMALED